MPTSYQFSSLECSPNDEGVMCRVVEFSDKPAGMMLYEGVFFSRSQAESYLIAHSHSVPDDNLQHHHKCTVTHSECLFAIVTNHNFALFSLGFVFAVSIFRLGRTCAICCFFIVGS